MIKRPSLGQYSFVARYCFGPAGVGGAPLGTLAAHRPLGLDRWASRALELARADPGRPRDRRPHLGLTVAFSPNLAADRHGASQELSPPGWAVSLLPQPHVCL